MVSGDLRVPVGADLIDMYSTGDVTDTTYASTDFFAVRGTGIDTRGDRRGHFDYSGDADEFSSMLRRTNIKQIYAFEEDSVLGYLPLDIDLNAQARLAGVTPSFHDDAADRKVGEKCVEHFFQYFYNLIFLLSVTSSIFWINFVL